MNNESSSGKVIAIIVAIAVLVGGVAFVSMSGDDEESTASNDTSTSQQESSDMADAPAEQNIVVLAQATPELSTLVTAVVAADLADTLASEGPYTVFAPTNEAFAALPEGTLEDLLKPENKEDLAGILTYHVVSGDVKSSDLKDGQEITTLQGDKLTVKITDGVVTINGAEVTTADVEASNGTVHIIDEVLLPQ